jgi:putative SOS response-associated peptidase YedK
MNFDFLTHDYQVQIGFDYGKSAVLIPNGRDDFDIVQMEWGFLPQYIRTREEAFKMRNGYKTASGIWKEPMLTLNAKAEELLKPGKIFREAALHRRCLILSTGFYEWRHVKGINKRTGKELKTAVKYPYHIGLKNREYFYIAAIYEPWTDIDTEEHVNTCAMITTEANDLMKVIHNTKNRQPAILTDELACEWLLGDLDEERVSEIARFQIPAHEMEACTVCKDFKSSNNPSEPFVYDELLPLDGSGDTLSHQPSLF